MNIILCCNLGMSTSILVKKMKDSAIKMGLQNVEVLAVPANEVKDYVEKADVILLGPQVRYQLHKMKELGDQYGIKVDSINPMHYGMGNGEEVLKHALLLAERA